MLKFRDLTAGEIDCRVATCKENGVSLLLYKDARCDMNILDETVGAENWQRSHELINGNLFCNVGININYGKELPAQWVFKQDVGTESYTEKEKGQASDSFKRACFNWGIGRELYTAPFIWINPDGVKLKSSGDRAKRYVTNNKFSVAHIDIKNKKIVSLSIKNDDLDKVVYEFPKPKGQAKPTEPDKNKPAEPKQAKPAGQSSHKEPLANAEQIEELKSIQAKHPGFRMEDWMALQGKNWETLTEVDAGQMLNALKEKYGDE